MHLSFWRRSGGSDVDDEAEARVAGADLVVFVVDGREGLAAGDETIAQELRATGKPVVLAVNKTDDKQARAQAAEFHRLGIDTQVEIAAEHGEGVAVMVAIKRALDPHGIMNPGKTVPP